MWIDEKSLKYLKEKNNKNQIFYKLILQKLKYGSGVIIKGKFLALSSFLDITCKWNK